MSIAAIILAAGSSTRLGRPKQLIVFEGETLLTRATRTAVEAGFSPILAVIADPALAPIIHTAGAIPTLNSDPSAGIASSIRTGITALTNRSPSSDVGFEGAELQLRHESDEEEGALAPEGRPQISGVVLLPCDQPTLTPAHLKALCANPHQTTGSAYAGRIGIPAYFPASAFPSLLTLQGDTGARHLLQHARSIPNESLAFDIDTEADLHRLQQTGDSNPSRKPVNPLTLSKKHKIPSTKGDFSPQ